MSRGASGERKNDVYFEAFVGSCTEVNAAAVCADDAPHDAEAKTQTVSFLLRSAGGNALKRFSIELFGFV